MQLPAAKDVHLDIDQYLNPYIPRSRLSRLPASVARFLGYRESPNEGIGDVLVCLWSFVGAFCGILLVTGVFQASPVIQALDPPLIFASLGATAVLNYHSIESPLAQPRNCLLGHTFSAVIGVGVTKLFMLNENFESLRWIAGSLSCALACLVMGLANTVHPPGGAAALIAAVDPVATRLGWTYVGLDLLGALLMLICALLVNNIQRRYPVYWWTPRDVGKAAKPDIERVPPSLTLPRRSKDGSIGGGGFIGTPPEEEQNVVITQEHIIVPDGLNLALEEKQILRILRDRLRDNAGDYQT